MTSHNTRRSFSVSSSDALYHPIPQAPVASSAAVPPAAVDLELEGEPDDTELDVSEVPLYASVLSPRIRWIQFILGCAVLLPWNAMITATPYFLSRLDGSPYASSFSSYLSCTFTIANFGFLAHAVATSKQSSPSARVTYSLIIISVLTLLLTLSTFVPSSPGPFFTFVILNGLAQAAAGSYLQTSVVAVASLFGPAAMQAVMVGQTAVGVAVSLVQVFSAAAFVHTTTTTSGGPNDFTSIQEQEQSQAPPQNEGKAETRSAFLFFGLSTLFLLGSALAQMWLTRMSAYRTVLASFHGHAKDRRPSEEERRPLTEEGGGGGGRREEGESEWGRIWRVAKANWVYEVAVGYVFTVTLAVFPPITIAIRSTNPAMNPLLFSSIHFLIYNLGDFIGRYVCSFPRLLIWSAKRLLALSLARTVFIPLFLLCNVQRSSQSLSLDASPLITSDSTYLFLLLVFGVSNGYVCSISMMSAPSLEHNPRLKGRKEDVDVAATISSFCLVLGLMVGSAASFGVRAVVCGGCNVFKG